MREVPANVWIVSKANFKKIFFLKDNFLIGYLMLTKNLILETSFGYKRHE
jgi:hypothetical protein